MFFEGEVGGGVRLGDILGGYRCIFENRKIKYRQFLMGDWFEICEGVGYVEVLDVCS